MSAKNDLKIEWRSLSTLKPYEANAKAHPPEQIEKIVRSISEFGWKVPLVVTSGGEIIAGHGRAITATQMQLAKVPVIVADDLSEAQVKAYRLADNKVAESEWIDDLLAEELQGLEAIDFDLKLTGFDDSELKELLNFGSDIDLGAETEQAEPESVEDGTEWIRAKVSKDVFLKLQSIYDSTEDLPKNKNEAWGVVLEKLIS